MLRTLFGSRSFLVDLPLIIVACCSNNYLIGGKLNIAGRICKQLAAAVALIVLDVTFLGAACGVCVNLCHAVGMTQSRSNDIAALCAGLRRGFGRCRTRSMCYRSVVGVVIAALMRVTAFALVAPSGLIIAMRACVGAFIPLIACRRIVLGVVIAACAVIPIGIVAAAIGCGSLLVCSILNSLGIVVTESGENNTAVIGDLYIGCRILKPLAADIALVVCLVAVFGAGGSLSRNRCQAVSCKRQVRNSADLVAVLVEELSAVIALGIGFPALFFTGGRLFANICLVRVGARCRYDRNGAECRFFTRSRGNNSRTGSNCSNFTGTIDGCNIASAGIPGYGVSRIGRFNCGNQRLAFANCKFEGTLVK